MNGHLIWIFLWNGVLNSLLSFMTLALAVEAFLFLVRIKNERARYLMRCVPIIKLPLDLLFFNVANWALYHGINPLECEPGTRFIQLQAGYFALIGDIIPSLCSGLRFGLADGKSFSLADIAALYFPVQWVQFIGLAAVIFSAISFFTFLKSYFKSTKWLKRLIKNASPSSRPITNPALFKILERSKLPVLVCPAAHSPFAAGLIKRVIVIPEYLANTLSQNEFEAILAHELEHLRWYDPAVKLCLNMICSLFWWVPAGWWLSRIEQEQELACDRSTQSKEVDQLDLATAIKKTVLYGGLETPAAAYHFATKKTVLVRLKQMAMPKFDRPARPAWWQFILITCVMDMLLFGKFWTI